MSIASCFSYSFANTTGSCSTCTSMPAKLGQINSMTTEILAAIPTVGTANPYMGKPVSPTRFESGKFSPPKTSVISKTLRRARESLGSIISLERIYLEGTLWNTILGKTSGDEIIKKGTIYKRDWAKMEDIQQLINNKKFALSVGGGRSSSIRGKIFEKIQGIIEKYKKSGLLDSTSTIEAGITYSEMIKTLEDLNLLAKAQISNPKENRINQEISRDGIIIIVDKVAAQSIIDGYKCVAEQKCNSSLSQLKIDLKAIGDLAKNGFKSTMSEISLSTEKLIATIQNLPKPTKNNTEDAETKALRNRFGLKTSQIQDAGVLGFNSPRRRSQRQTVKEGATDMFGSQEDNKEIKPILQGGEMEIEMKIVMSSTANDILKEAKDLQDYVILSENKDVLTRFGALSKQLHELNTIIGDKSSTNGLIRNFGEICKLQCSNITSKSCYY